MFIEWLPMVDTWMCECLDRLTSVCLCTELRKLDRVKVFKKNPINMVNFCLKSEGYLCEYFYI